MILILSQENDFSTYQVEKWLKYYNKAYTRINKEDRIEIVEIIIENDLNYALLKINGKQISTNEISSIWYRRGQFKFNIKLPDLNFLDGSNRIIIESHLIGELNTIEWYLYYILFQKKGINNIKDTQINKLQILHIASQIGLKIPKTIITNESTRINNFDKENIITKSIKDGCGIKTKDNKQIALYTEKIEYNHLINTKNFFPTLFQENINKVIDLRVFFLEDQFYAMAIFSQKSTNTSIDFRKYDQEKPNRTVPFNLPVEILEKLKLLSKKTGINSGSIDMVYTNTNDYYFLEINPVGQFAMLSEPCNYFLERQIAQFL